MKYFYLTLIIALSYSCTKSPSKAYFAGEIVNPNNDFVYLYYNNAVIDSSKIDQNNRFFFEVDDIHDGLYHFDHNEYQYIILEKGDSLLMRLNTLDFDESLVYSGIGASKNNFLIDMFLIYEDEEKAVNKFSELDPDEFVKKIDSLRSMKQELLNDINQENILSPVALHITQGAINYRYFTDMEEYPFINKRRNGLHEVSELPKNFYQFRRQVDYNDTLLTYYRPYFNYLVTHFNNLSYNYCKNQCNGDLVKIQRSLHYSTHKLRLIDSAITKNKTIRDNLTRNVAYSYLLGDHTANYNQRFLDSFSKYAPDNQHQKEITTFYNNVQQLQKGLTLPPIHLINLKGEKVTIDSTSYSKNTVFYFWNLHQRNHQTNVLMRIARLKRDYPNYNYIGINVNENRKEWQQSLASISKLDDTLSQYQTDNIEELLATLVIKSLNKIIIVDKNGKIIEGFGDIYHSKRLEISLSESMKK
ncbi:MULTISPECIES: TlpA family protein disulfide reductase [Galbibacter]|uniref:Thioredoxin-like domain-containing protein n=1 Tax=Galbibacter pacificus TaxID=2996052 RepID=A0ABT6FQT0_9FLAO|nr:thioredoxin-like domain-containing protein [Galbibacter pacificus]MDG3581895.1 thioredoxin-like domain-containing protein [Galbibacter pacificus]MDG3585631.1 thioredoxin-like domain-containing protein [Galbibacter pacificus]